MAGKNTRKDELNKGLLIKMGLGLSPIPIVGEVALSMGFYDVLKESGQDAILPLAGIPAAILTRYAMYTEFYIPIAQNLGLIN